MKNLFTFFLLSLITVSLSNAQSLDIDLVTNTHNGGYHVSCFGGNDASVSPVVSGGTAPYTYSWSNGSNTADIVNVAAGTYTLTVTDSLGLSNTATIVLTQPTKLSVNISSYRYPGDTDISTHGASDGRLGADVSGGTPPYTYIWSTTDGTPQVNGNTNDKLNAVKAGTYSVVVTDANGCAYSAAYTMTEPDPLVATLNAPMTGGSWNLSCNGGADGSIDLTVTGGIPPYRYDWSHGEFSEDVSELRAGEYTVRITDQNEAEIQETITLTEPTALTVELDQNLYPNNYHVSCHDCYNGAATLTLTGGASGYSILWPDGNTNATRNDLGLDEYMVRMTDANGCEATELVRLMIPERDDWTMQGNAIGPQQFIGSTNAADVEFRANNQPQLRLGSDGVTELLGGVKLSGLALPSTEHEMLVVDNLGNLQLAGGFSDQFTDALMGPCGRIVDGVNYIPSWTSATGIIYADCEPLSVGIGTDNPSSKLHVTGTIRGHKLRVQSNVDPLEIFDGAGDPLLSLERDGDNVVLRTGPWVQEGDDATLYLGNNSHFIRSMPFEGIQIGVAGANGSDPQNPDNREALVIENWSGKVGIGVGVDHTFGEGLLEVNGAIRAKEAIVEIVDWPDYVFNDSYNLKPLDEVAQFIDQHGHLPDVPSAKEAETNGNRLGEMDKILLRKVEELTLYVLDLQRQNDELQQTVEQLQNTK